MHRYIMGVTSPKDIVDHKNNDIADNRKENLRICNASTNSKNKSCSRKCRSGHLGIRITEYGKYNVRITLDGKEIYIGNYDTILEAIEARKAAEDKYHGEYGSHNN